MSGNALHPDRGDGTDTRQCVLCGTGDAGRRDIRTSDPGPRGQGVICAPVSLCTFCREFVAAPIEDGCLVCGASETAFSFELEGVAGVDDVDIHYSGCVCRGCSRDLLFDLQQRAANTPHTVEGGEDAA